MNEYAWLASNNGQILFKKVPAGKKVTVRVGKRELSVVSPSIDSLDFLVFPLIKEMMA